ncbi:hypothetical protein [Acidiferrobacter sp.]|uniref:hypothetical protein n=1 Tax=Acidiferrobacter sp. TaxID=1872107 RepID=UPI00261C008F|nr:hypothetical protein [Acidiferrobacter sp.]
MASILESFVIESQEYGKSFRIDLVEGLDEDHIKYIDDQWMPPIKRLYNKAILHYFTQPLALQTDATFVEILGKLGIPDQHWNWRRKCGVAPGANRKVYGLLNADHVEAAMMLLFGKSTRGTPAGLPIVYVDYIAVAPWNRRAIQDPERFRKLGTVMLGTAVAVSRTLGLDGRCGLHSLQTSEGFYRRIGMKDLDIDPTYHNLRYFEFDANSASTFVKTGAL